MAHIGHILHDPSLKIVFAGVGNLLRKDDGVGPFIAHRIRKNENRIVFIPESGIDRYIQSINKERPDAFVIIDCMEMGKPAGHWQVFSIDQITDTTCHSHNISLKKLGVFFRSETWVIGVQPADIGVGEGISPEVNRAAAEIIAFINNY